MKTLYEFLVKGHVSQHNQYEIAEITTMTRNFKRTYVIINKDNKDDFINDVKHTGLNDMDDVEIIYAIDDFFNNHISENKDCICFRPKDNANGFTFIYRKYDDIKSDIIGYISLENFTLKYWKTNYKEIKLK